ncbi:MAG: hypothetical protein P8H03_06405 [Emcibacteraceae bacterium]|nr:hypothetical protein [Emcibacteraceae bacterium]
MYNIEFFSNSWHVVSAMLVFVLGLFISIGFSRVLRLGDKITVTLYCYHSFFCIVYLFLALKSGNRSDVVSYYLNGELFLADFRPGTTAIIYLVSYLHQIDLSIFGMFLVFNILGFIGLSFFYAALKNVTKKSSIGLRRLVLLLIFLPSVSFWSSGLGKDAISFMAIGMALYAALNLNKRFVLMMLAVALMLVVRPHIAGMMTIAIMASIAFKKDIPLLPRVIIGAIGLVSVAVILPFALNYAGLESDASNLDSYIEKYQGHNQKGEGAVDISSMPLLMQMYSYGFRPLPFEARSFLQLLASLDNMVIFYLLFLGLKSRSSVKNLQLTGNRVFMWWYVGISWVLLSMTTANLGIAMRQKWMFVPILMFLLISIIAAAQDKKKKNNSYGNN